jgi:hypothetical protein
MSTDASKLGRSSAGFALAAALTVLFNTGLALVKDADHTLLNFMNGVTGNNWITQGLADVILFLCLGLLFSKIGWAEKVAPNLLISFLAVAVAVAGVGLFVWYALF